MAQRVRGRNTDLGVNISGFLFVSALPVKSKISLLFSLSFFNYLPYLWIFKKDFVYLLLEKEEGRKKERERNIDMLERHQSVAFPVPPVWGPAPRPRHVPWLGIKPVTFRFTGQRSIHWATPARAPLGFLKYFLFTYTPL